MQKQRKHRKLELISWNGFNILWIRLNKVYRINPTSKIRIHLPKARAKSTNPVLFIACCPSSNIIDYTLAWTLDAVHCCCVSRKNWKLITFGINKFKAIHVNTISIRWKTGFKNTINKMSIAMVREREREREASWHNCERNLNTFLYIKEQHKNRTGCMWLTNSNSGWVRMHILPYCRVFGW